MTFLHPEYLFLTPAALVLGLFMKLGWERAIHRRRNWLASDPGVKGNLRALIWGLQGLLLILALGRPVWSPETITSKALGQTVVFLVDVSRSMLTPDMDPNRLEATKEALLRVIPNLEGDQAALVAFSGTSVVRSPLTQDKSFLTQAVGNLSTSLAARGGTLVGDALRQVEKTFGAGVTSGTIWLFTDGGDQESFPVEAAQSLAKKGWRIMVWGLGTDTGALVPDREINSALNRNLLQKISQASPEGQYFDGSPQNFPSVYRSLRKVSGDSQIAETIWTEGSYYLLWLMLLLFALDIFLTLRRPEGK